MMASERMQVKTLVPYPCRCAQCARIKGPVVRTYNNIERSTQLVCIGCYAELSNTGIFDAFITQEVN